MEVEHGLGSAKEERREAERAAVCQRGRRRPVLAGDRQRALG